jgi:hypothetical protein
MKTQTDLINKIAENDTSMLKTIAKQLNDREGKEVDLVLGCVLDVLMQRLSTDDFVNFCDTLTKG